MDPSKILIVEDEPDLVELLEYNLTQEGYGVSTVREGAAGLELARRIKFDLILLDLMLPDMEGFEFCRVLREEAQTPIFFLTAAKDPVCRSLSMKLGANDYITKPFSIEDLLGKIHRTVVNARPVASKV